MDVIALNGIRASGKHGANPGERDREQPFDLDLEIEVDLRAAAASDDLADTVNYAQLQRIVAGVVRDRSFALIERLADAVLEAVFADERIHAATIRVAKPRLLSGATPSVLLRRQNPRRAG